MASTFSDLKIELIGTGEQVGTWGSTTNTNLGTAVEEAIVGSADVSFSSADVTVTLTNSNGTQVARHLRLNLTGTSGGARQLILGSGCQIEKPYIINNGLADAVTVKNTTGTGVVVPAGKSMWVFNNSVNVVEITTHTPVSSGGTGASTLTANNVIIGNGTSAVNFVAPGALGNVLVSNGTTWTSVAAASGGVTSVTASAPLASSGGATPNISVTGTLAIANGGTGQTGTPTNGQLLIGNGSGFTRSTLTAGSNITITNSSGSISIAATGGSGTVTSVSGTGTVSGLTLTGTVTTSGSLTLGGAITNVGGLILSRGGSSIVNNVAVGTDVLAANTTGSFSTAVGFRALESNTSGRDNAGYGALSLVNCTTGENNTAVGTDTSIQITTGLNNTSIGKFALFSLTTGSNNTGIGHNADVSSASVSNTITLGNSSITTLRCQVTTITSLSDVRDKTNIVDIPAGLSFIKELHPVSFDWNMRDGGKVGVREFGFIAQDLQKAQIDTGITVPNLVYDDNLEKLEASPSTLIPILVKAIQELNSRLDAQDIEIAILKGN